MPFNAHEPHGLKRVATPQHPEAYGEKAVANYQAFERAVVRACAAQGKERKV